MNEAQLAEEAIRLMLMSEKTLGVIFSPQEIKDISNAARERGRSIHGLVHDAVMEALYQ